MGVPGGADVALRIAGLLHRWSTQDRADREYAVVVATRDEHVDPGAHFADAPDMVDSWPAHCVAGTDGAAFHPNLDPQPFDAVFDKGAYKAAYSGFEGTDRDGRGLGDWLRLHGVTETEIVGLATDHCVRATAMDALLAGFDTTVRLDLTAGVSRATTAAAVVEMAASGATLIGRPHGMDDL